MSIDHSAIEAVAPDQASLNAARKLLKQAKWSLLAEDADKSLLWGSCQGSGSTPYSVTVARSDLGAKCTCPSRKFPCKHAIALMWWYADQEALFKTEPIPEFVSLWLSRRRGTNAKSEEEKPSTKKSIALSDSAPKTKPKDPERAAKAAARTRKKRESSILQGLDELETWILDQVDTGLANFGARAQEQCRLMSQRLVDAKAGGLATAVQDIATDYFSTSQQQRPEMLVTAFGQLYLLANAYRKQQALPAPLVADLRRHTGWSTSREEVLRSKDSIKQDQKWAVLANRSVVQSDRLIRQETWLCGQDPSNTQRFAVLQDFVPAAVSGGSSPALLAGHELNAELSFYHSATPLRAQISKQHSVKPMEALPQLETSPTEIHIRYQSELVKNPWLDVLPVMFDGELKYSKNGQHWLDTGTEQLAVDNTALRALWGYPSIRGCGLYNGRSLHVLALHSALGSWWSVPK